jgi:hypothetical protein
VTITEVKHRLRARSEYALRLAAMEDMARRYPGRTVTSALPRVGPFWRYVFVPLFRRVPWSFKHDAMRTLKMTARDWPEDARRFGEPWRPPVSGERVARDWATNGRGEARRTEP